MELGAFRKGDEDSAPPGIKWIEKTEMRSPFAN
jgi:hypothetical protein